MSTTQHSRQTLVARLLEQRGIQAKTAATVPFGLQPAEAQWLEPFPLTDVQQAYWLGRNATFVLGGVSSHSYQEFELDEWLDRARYEQAWNTVIARHPMLRTVVCTDGMQQTLAEAPRFAIACQDLRPADESTSARALEAWREELSHQCLPADRWPLFCVRLSLLPGERTRIHFSGDALFWDAHSDHLIFEEVHRFYTHPAQTIPRPSVGFRDYVLALDRQRDTDEWRRAQAYWRSRILEFPLAPELPLSKPLEQLGTPRFVRHQFCMPGHEWRQLSQRAQQQSVTPSVLLLSAFSEVLRQWSGTADFSLNVTLFNRPDWHPDLPCVVGDFTTTLLIACHDRAAEGFASTITGLQQQFLEALDHRHYSGVQVLRDLARQRHDGTQFLMPVVFTSALTVGAETADTPPMDPFGNEVYGITQTPQVLIDHQVYLRSGDLIVNWDVVDEAFPPGVIQSMFAAYRALLAQLLAPQTDWQQPLVHPLPARQDDARRIANATTTVVDEHTLHGPLLRRIREQPAATAIINGSSTLSYGELGQWAGAVMAALGDVRGQRVAILLPKGWQQVAAAVGVAASGGTYVPIGADWPDARIRGVLERVRPAGVLTSSKLALCLGPLTNAIDIDCLQPAELPTRTAGPAAGDLAYIVFTSGSSGEPKGVMIEHGAAANTLWDMNRRFSVGPTDRVLALSSLCFDLSVYDIFGVLGAGGALVIPGVGHERDPEHWLGECSRHGVTLWNSVPALLQMLVDHAGEQLSILGDLRIALLSGDWIPTRLPDAARRHLPQLQVHSLGGATEASIWSIHYPIATVPADWPSIPYGRPLANQRFHVLDAKLQPRPDWVCGQLYIAGRGLARGYWDDEGQTQARFFVHPHTGERLYDTGDLGRYLPDGTLEFLGRNDQQVKIGGYRVELGEIEARLAQHPAVTQCAVQLHRNGRSQQLVAYVVAASPVDDDELKRHLAEQLPGYMLPSAFVRLNALPLSANGKVNRAALPSPAAPAASADGLPQDATERTLASHACAAFGLDHVPRASNFFDLGVNSLDIVALYRRLDAALPGRLTLLQLFEQPSIARLAAGLREAAAGDVPTNQQTHLEIARRRGAMRRGRHATNKGDT